MDEPAHETWSISALIEAAFAEWQDDDGFSPCPATVELHRRGTRQVLDAAITLCSSLDPDWRALGAHLLGQLGQPDRTFPEECCDALLALLHDPAEEVVSTALHALGHLCNRRADVKLLFLANHPYHHVRRGVGFALHGTASVEAVPTLLRLMKDQQVGVRDWSTTALAATDFDTPEIRASLFERATIDEDDMTRGEALHGLARRGDGRVVKLLIAELHGPKPHLFEEAARTWLGIEFVNRDVPVEILLEGLRASRH